MKQKYLLIANHRAGYTPEQCGDTLTVGELIDILKGYDKKMPVLSCNDGGYTYGNIGEYDFFVKQFDNNNEG